jgi:hypothetical protein
MKLEYYSDIKDGNLQTNIRKLIAEQLPRFNGKRVTITIEKAKKQRSDPQNRFYWGVIIKEQQQCFLERWGELFDAEQVHDWNKANIWYEERINEQSGEVFKIPGSSKKQSTFQFEERLEKLRQFFWNSFDWKLSLPNEQKDLSLE